MRLGTLGRDISIVLVVKLAVLVLLWWAFFSHPVAPHMTVPAPSVAAHVVPPTDQSPHANR